MVKMSAVWDRTVEVINGRTAMLASIAALTLWLPSMLRDLFAYAAVGGAAPAGAPGSGASALWFVLSLVTAALTILGQLALIAVASDPATTRNDALRIAARRLPVAIGLALLLGLLVFVLLVPVVATIAAAWPDPEIAMMSLAVLGPFGILAPLSPETRAFVGLYLLVFALVMLWLAARLALLNPVIVNERIGVGSFARSFALTRGLTWKIVGLVILFAIVAGVVVLAAQSVVGIVFRLVLGVDNLALARLLTAAVLAAVTSAITIVWTTFLAQLYVATREAPHVG